MNEILRLILSLSQKPSHFEIGNVDCIYIVTLQLLSPVILFATNTIDYHTSTGNRIFVLIVEHIRYTKTVSKHKS